jgi:hypothetical protein
MAVLLTPLYQAARGRLFRARTNRGRPSPQSNDVDIDDRGLIYLADRIVILELRR